MPRRKWVDKKSATTFALVHRPQNDPRIHDEGSSSMVLAEVAAPNKKIKTKEALEEELGLDPSSVRENEGEAALHGIFYDDTNYDYMQHMRDLGTSTEGQFVDARPRQDARNKGKGKQKLEDALRETHLDDDILEVDGVRLTTPRSLLDTDILPSTNLSQRTYQDQQDIPDALAGFQPDMDPRLREVLEALEDDAYVDDEEDLFAELSKDAKEISLQEFENAGQDEPLDLDEGWETDDTAKPGKEFKTIVAEKNNSEGDVVMEDSSNQGNGAWMAEFGKFKSSVKARATKNANVPSSVITGSSTSGIRHKKRKGAMTSSTGYSMTSSSLYRTEGLTLLDDRFDKIEKQYADADDDDDDDDGGISIAPSAFSTTSSQNPPALRSDFDDMMDDFLGEYSMSGKKRIKRVGPQSGLDQLDEIRRQLGPAHLRREKTVRT